MAPIETTGQDYLGFAYAVLLAAGGIIGAVRKGSLMSLVMGLGGGYLASVGAKKVSENKHDVYLSLAVSWTLTVVMGIRFMRKWSFMPAGLIMLVSVIMGSYYSLQLVDADTGPIHIPGTKLEL